MKFFVKLVELLCFLVLSTIGALVVGIGLALACPGIAIRWAGDWIVDFGRRFE